MIEPSQKISSKARKLAKDLVGLKRRPCAVSRKISKEACSRRGVERNAFCTEGAHEINRRSSRKSQRSSQHKKKPSGEPKNRVRLQRKLCCERRSIKPSTLDRPNGRLARSQHKVQCTMHSSRKSQRSCQHRKEPSRSNRRSAREYSQRKTRESQRWSTLRRIALVVRIEAPELTGALYVAWTVLAGAATAMVVSLLLSFDSQANAKGKRSKDIRHFG